MQWYVCTHPSSFRCFAHVGLSENFGQSPLCSTAGPRGPSIPCTRVCLCNPQPPIHLSLPALLFAWGFYVFAFFFFFLRATPTAYGGSQARGWIGARAPICIHLSFKGHTCGIWTFPGLGSNWSRSRRPTPQPLQLRIQVASATYMASQQCWILNPLSGARDGTWILTDTSWVCFCWAATGPP